MLDAISRAVFGRSRLQWTLPKVAGILKERYGGGGAYTAGQARRAIEEAKAGADLHPLLYAAACGEAEFLRAQPNRTAEDYQALREEIIEILELPPGTFSIKNYMPKHRIPVGNSDEGTSI